ncbi:MAG: hypothetical protein K2Q03_05385 [Sphingobacteriaceae bacterium]|nr:hypothetical protein [Sphingobacteriaceae bacterium]
MNSINFTDLIQDKKDIRNTHINIDTGEDIIIKDLATLIQNQIGFQGSIEFDVSKPDGTMKKLQEVSKLNALGWKHKIELSDGIQQVAN